MSSLHQELHSNKHINIENNSITFLSFFAALMHRKVSLEKSNAVFKVYPSTLTLDEETPPHEMTQLTFSEKDRSKKVI